MQIQLNFTLLMGEKDFDVIIVGAGISGLTAAALLAKYNLRVCVLEKHAHTGGYLQGFHRRGFHFDTAIHWLNQCGEQGTVTRVFRLIGSSYPKAETMTGIQRHLHPHHNYLLNHQPDELKEQLIKDFPQEEQGIRRFFKEAQKIARVSRQFNRFFRSPETYSKIGAWLYSIRRFFLIIPLIKHVFYHGEEGVKKGLSRYFKDEQIHELFCAEQDMLSCLFPVAWAYNQDYQYPPLGGSRTYPMWLVDQIKQSDSEIRTNAGVNQILLKNGQFDGVSYTQQGVTHSIKSKYLLAACDIHQTYQWLANAGVKGADFQLKNLQKIKLYSSSVTLSIALDCRAEDLGFSKELILLCEKDVKRMEHSSGNPHKSAISILAPSSRDQSLAPEGNGTLTIYVPAWMDYKEEWQTTRDEQGKIIRTDDYKNLKNEFANTILDRVEQAVCPELRQHIIFMDVATPVTYYRYTSNKDGSMMGGRPGKENMQNKVAHYRTPLPNVFISGQWAELGGGVPIAVKAGYNASLLVLRKENPDAYKKLIASF